MLNESYFTSRIWDKVIISQLDVKNLQLFITQKLSKAGLDSVYFCLKTITINLCINKLRGI
ncbi:MAG: hypothetical protein IKC84_00655 [Helicobacteraceae bacterium]|nr:hypothetical protein [Helicobacteraceae bacterium]